MKGNMIQSYIHFVWTTKNREPVLNSTIRHTLYDHIRQNAVKKGIFLDCINGIEDHAHCLVSMTGTQSISEVMKLIKGESSNWLNKAYFKESPFSWGDGYGAFSVSPQNLQKVRNYIFNQERHHKKMSFDEEMALIERMFPSKGS